MRRHEQEIRDWETIESILSKALVCRLGLSDNNLPYVVPVCFGLDGKSLYIHSSSKGKKVDIIRRNQNVCFEVDVDVELVTAESACRYSMRYNSVIGYGRAYFVEDPDEKRQGLNAIMKQYAGGSDHEYLTKGFELATIIRIDIDSMTGKHSKK